MINQKSCKTVYLYKMSLAIIQKFLDYEKGYAFNQILHTLRIALQLNKSDPTVYEIFEFHEIDTNIDTLIQIIDKYLLHNHEDTFKAEQSNSDLGKKPVASLYYALYVSFELKDKTAEDFTNNINIKRIFAIVLKFNSKYFIYKNEDTIRFKTSDQLKRIFDEVVVPLTRVIEILAQFALYKDKSANYIFEIYFKTEIDLEKHFYTIMENDSSKEHDYFSIRQNNNHNKNKSLFIVYENYHRDIKIQIQSSREIKRGKKNEESPEINTNIVRYLQTGYTQYRKFLKLDTDKKEIKARKNSKHKTTILQDTQEDELLDGVWSDTKNYQNEQFAIPDKAYALNKTAKKIRFNDTSLYNKEAAKESTTIPNIRKQREKIKAFSANITKRTLLLESNYDLPPLNIFKNFIKEFSSSNNPIEFVYNSIFILDSTLGIGYAKIIELMENKKKSTIKLRGDRLQIPINEKLFSKYQNEYIGTPSLKISYSIPNKLVLLLEKSSDIVIENSFSQLNSEDEAKKYFTYINEKRKLFPSTIHFNPKHMWKLITCYVRSFKSEDMTTMFCTGSYQQNDTPRLAYASTPSHSQKHSKLIEKLYALLELDEILEGILTLDKKDVLDNETFYFDSDVTFSGSSQAADKELTKKFFTQMYESILSCKYKNSELYFNIVSMYTRYALSFLLGTRDYHESAKLDRCSLFTSTLVITEKSASLLSGVRIIPLCDTAKKIITNYKSLCEQFEIEPNNIYLLIEKNVIIFNQYDAVKICKKNNLNPLFHQYIDSVPLNTGRHIIAKHAFMTNFPLHYLESLLGHYTSGGEQFGIYSNMDCQEYIEETRNFLESIANEYHIR